MPQFLVDHNVPIKVYHWLCREKFQTTYVADIDPEIPDREIAKIAEEGNFIVITNDRDFLDLSLLFPNLSVIVFAFRDQKAEVRIEALKKVIPELRNQKEKGLLLVLKDH